MPLVITGGPKAKAEEKKKGRIKGVGRKGPSKGRQVERSYSVVECRDNCLKDILYQDTAWGEMTALQRLKGNSLQRNENPFN